MTKKELAEAIAELSSNLERLRQDTKNVYDDLKDVCEAVDNLPQNEDEITEEPADV